MESPNTRSSLRPRWTRAVQPFPRPNGRGSSVLRELIRDEAIDAVRERWLALLVAARTITGDIRRRLALDASGKRLLTAVMGFRALWDEALLSLCLVFAIAAVVAPIMVLAGLKFGFIEF